MTITTPDETAGRVAVITGASSGIGEATAPALLASGLSLMPLYNEDIDTPVNMAYIWNVTTGA